MARRSLRSCPARAFDAARARRRVVHRRDGDDQSFEKSLLHLVKGADPRATRRRERMIVLDDREDAWCVRSRPHVLQIPQVRAPSEAIENRRQDTHETIGTE